MVRVDPDAVRGSTPEAVPGGVFDRARASEAPGPEGAGIGHRRSRWVRRAAVLVAFVLAGGAGGAGGAWFAQHRAANSASSVKNLMGLSSVPVKAAPGFALRDQAGQGVSLSQLRGKAVVLNFFDDRCIDVCPIIAQELVLASRHLGSQASRVAFVAINVNAAHASTADVKAFTEQHGLGRLANWYFLTGPKAALERVWQRYNIAVQVDPKTGEVLHTTPMYFIGPHGNERAVAAPSAETLPNGHGYLPAGQIAQWGGGIAKEASLVLKGG